MLARQFTGGLYAAMTIYDALDDPFARIPAGWEYLHNWVVAHPQYEPAEHQMLEEVIVTAGDCAGRTAAPPCHLLPRRRHCDR